MYWIHSSEAKKLLLQKLAKDEDKIPIRIDIRLGAENNLFIEISDTETNILIKHTSTVFSKKDVLTIHGVLMPIDFDIK